MITLAALLFPVLAFVAIAILVDTVRAEWRMMGGIAGRFVTARPAASISTGIGRAGIVARIAPC